MVREIFNRSSENDPSLTTWLISGIKLLHTSAPMLNEILTLLGNTIIWEIVGNIR